MRRVPESEVQTEFERQYAWGDDERHYYSRLPKKASVMSFFLRLNTVIDLVKKYSPGNKIADFASAQGTFSVLLAEQGYKVTAVDIHPEFLRYALKKNESKNLTTVQANIIDYRSADPYDCILLGEVIEHVAFPDQLLKSAHENLKQGGVLVLTTPNGSEAGQNLPTYSQVQNIEELIPQQFHWGNHLFLYTERELRELCATQGFRVLEVIKQNSSYVSQIKGLRYLIPLSGLKWLEKMTRNLKRKGQESTNSIILVAQKS